MGLDSQRFLGHIVDPDDAEQDQSEMNEDLLYEHDQLEFLRSFNYRISEPMLQFYVDHLDLTNVDYFTIVLNSFARAYSLNYLKLHVYNITDRSQYIKEILQTIRFVKIKLISLIEIKKIESDISREELEKFLIIENAPTLLIDCIKYIDGKSYKKFITKLFNEVKAEFIE